MKPDEYEEFVQQFCQEMLKCEGLSVERLKEFVGKTTQRRIKIDVSFETSVLGARVLCLVECKCYAKEVEVGDVEEFWAKGSDIEAHKLFMVTTVGYQSGAVQVAKARGIALAILRMERAPNEMVYMVRSAIPTLPAPDPAALIQGNLRFFGDVDGNPEDPGVRFNSGPELLRVIGGEMIIHRQSLQAQ